MRRRTLMLAGCGHANIQVLFNIAPIKNKLNLDLVVLNNSERVPYSGMVPGFIAGYYKRSDLEIDLRRICEKWGVFFQQEVIGDMHFDEKHVVTESGKKFFYDYISVNVGCTFKKLHLGPKPENLYYIRPIHHFLNEISQIRKKCKSSNTSIVIIGGGAAGFEIAMSLGLSIKAQLTLIAGESGLLAEYPQKTRSFAYKILKQQKFRILESHVINVSEKSISLKQGEIIPFDMAISAVSDTPPHCLKEGFLSINEYLQVSGYSNVFAAGDCSIFSPSKIPRAGVYAVKQGEILATNFKRLFQGKSLKVYMPQSHHLSLLLSGHKTVIFSKNKLNSISRGWWYLKDFIDRKFVEKFNKI